MSIGLTTTGNGSVGRSPGPSTCASGTATPAAATTRPRLVFVDADRHHVGWVAEVGDAELVEQRPVSGHTRDAEHLRDHRVNVERPNVVDSFRERQCGGLFDGA